MALFDEARKGERAYSTTVIISRKPWTEIDLYKPLPDIFDRLPNGRLDTVFDLGNAHVSRQWATQFVVHRTQLRQFKTAMALEDLDAVGRSLASVFDGLKNVMLSMYIPGLMSEKYKVYTGNPDITKQLERLEQMRIVLKDFVWRTQREDNPHQEPLTMDQLHKFGTAVEFIAESLERLVPELILNRYIDDRQIELAELLSKKPDSEHANWWRENLKELDMAIRANRAKA